MNNKFYVYVYLDTRKIGQFIYGNYTFSLEPFYVGKGKNQRYKDHLINAYKFYDKKGKDNNSFKCNKIRKIKKTTGNDPQILILEHFDDELKAFSKEEELIKLIGRKDIGTGPLTNFNNGGQGSALSESTKRELSLINIGKNHPQYKHVSEENIKEIIKLYVEEDINMKDIERKIGIKELKIRRILIENGIQIKPKGYSRIYKISDETEKNIIDNYKNHISIRDLSKKYKLPFERIRLIIKNNNIVRHNGFKRSKLHLQHQSEARRGKYKDERSTSYKKLSNDEKEKLVYLRLTKNYTYANLAKEFKLCQSKIIKELKKLGLVEWQSDISRGMKWVEMQSNLQKE